MWEMFLKVWYFIVILPILIFQEGWAMFKKFMDKRGLWWAFPYFLLAFLVALLIIFFAQGYRW